MYRFSIPRRHLSGRTSGRRGVCMPPPGSVLIQAMLLPEEYRKLLADKNEGGAVYRPNLFEQKVLSILEQYKFLTDEVRQLDESKGPKSAPKGLQETLYSALKALHNLEQLIFEWKRANEITEQRLNSRRKHDDFEINSHLLGEVQKERAFITHNIRFFRIPMMPSYRYGISKELAVGDKQALMEILESTKGRSLFPMALVHSHLTETMKDQLVSQIGQLFAFPSGVGLLSEFSKIRKEAEPVFELFPFSSSEHSIPKANFNLAENRLELSVNWSVTDYFTQIGLPESRRSVWGKGRRGASLQPDLVTYAPPYIVLAKLLAEYVYSKKGLKNSRLKEKIQETVDALYVEAGLEKPGTLSLTPRLTDEWLSIDIGESGESDELVYDMGAMEKALGSVHSGLEKRSATKPVREVSHGIQKPSGEYFQERQGVMSLMQPSLDFDPQQVDYQSLKKLGQQGLYGAVYEFKMLDGRELIIKLVSPDVTGYNYSFSWHPEKEAFASNFIRVMGRRTEAPETLAIEQNDPLLDEILQGVRTLHSPALRDEIEQKINCSKKSEFSHTCLIMEKMKGITRTGMSEEFGSGPGERLLREALDKPDVQAGLGELYLYDLLLGNFDRFWQTIQGGNVLFNLGLGKKEAYTGRVPFNVKTPPVHAIDQSVSVYGQYIFLGYLLEGKGSASVKKNVEYKNAGKYVEHADQYPLEYQAMITGLLHKLKVRLRTLLVNLLAGRLGDSMPRHFLMKVPLYLRESYIPLEIGMIEAMLKIKAREYMIEAFGQMKFPNFQQDASHLFNGCRMVCELIDEFNYDELIMRLSEEKSKIPQLSS
ncbi:MAG: hypothetical protein MI784_03865 [Cytophagales bacterium]|nr:hypothetical protein [Cytophagales bacterium]